MVAKTVEIAPDSELARLIDDAGDAELVLIKDGQRFRVVREPARKEDEDDLWAGYDPGAVRRSIEYGAGIISREEAERWKERIYWAREDGTRPPDRQR